MNAAIITPSWCADVWVMHQIFRTLGFEPEDIYFTCAGEAPTGRRCVFVTVKQGELEFSVTVAPVETAEAETYKIWSNFVEEINVAGQPERDAIWDSSVLETRLPRTELILRLIEKGMTLKSIPEEQAAMLRSLKRGES